MTGSNFRCAFLTQGCHVPSTRYRIAQFLELLPDYGISPLWLDSVFGAYPPRNVFTRPLWGFGAMVDGLRRVLRARGCDVTVIQRSLISSMRSFEGLSSGRLVLDVDDAIYLQGPPGWHDSLARRAAHIICGNEYLADHYRALAPVSVIPTTVDTLRFTPATSPQSRPVIGWSGTSGGLEFLYGIERGLHKVLQRFPSAKLKIISDRAPSFRLIPANRVIFEFWTPDSEVTSLKSFSMGLMPLPNTPWSGGKCAFKMLTYMAVGIPVVVSPVGANRQVLAMGQAGFAASSEDEWVDTLSLLIEEPELAAQMGKTGREIVQRHYDCRVHAPMLVEVLRKIAGT